MSMHSLRFHGVVASLILSLFVVPFEFAHGGTSLVQVATNTAVPTLVMAVSGIQAANTVPSQSNPEQAREAKYEGTVLLQAVVTLEGRATKIAVVKGPRRWGVEKSAIEALRTWRFKPAMDANGKPIAVITTIDVDFHLP